MKLNVEQYKSFLDELAKAKKIELAEIKNKMANCGPPGISNVGGVSSNIYNINIPILITWTAILDFIVTKTFIFFYYFCFFNQVKNFRPAKLRRQLTD